MQLLQNAGDVVGDREEDNSARRHSQCMHFVITVFRMFILHVEHFRILCVSINIRLPCLRRDMLTMHLFISFSNSVSLLLLLELAA